MSSELRKYGCLNEYGECTCGGTTYQTYYSSVKAVSGNSLRSLRLLRQRNADNTRRFGRHDKYHCYGKHAAVYRCQPDDLRDGHFLRLRNVRRIRRNAENAGRRQSGAEDPDAAVVTQVPDDTQQEDSSGDGTDGSDGQTDRNGETGEEDGANGAAVSDSEVLDDKARRL